MLSCVFQAHFQGDVSTWGHGGAGSSSSDGEGSGGSLSSGLSPRDGGSTGASCAFDQQTGMQVVFEARTLQQ